MNGIFIVRCWDSAPGENGAEGIWTDEAKAREFWEAYDVRYQDSVDLEFWEFKDGKGECARVLSRDTHGKVTEHD